MSLEWEVDGVDDTLIRVRGVNEDLRRQIQDILMDVAHVTYAEMLAQVPRDEDELAGSIRIGGLSFAPGGPGGGGYWEIEVGPGPDAPEHLDFIMSGTGIFGPSGQPITSSRGNVLQFMDGGGELYRHSVKGQRPQTEWITDAQETARNMVEVRVQTLDLGE